MRFGGERAFCPVAAYDRAGEGYAENMCEWLGNPYAHFRAFGPAARAFQTRHRSERFRVMTLVAPAEKFVALKPICMSVDGIDETVASWEQVFAITVSRLMAAHPLAFVAMQRDGLLAWLGCEAGGTPAAEMLATDTMRPAFADLAEVVARVQWLFLMCGIRLNEVIVQVDPYADDEWAVRKEEIDRKRSDEKAFMKGRRAAQRAWEVEHPFEADGCKPIWDGTN